LHWSLTGTQANLIIRPYWYGRDYGANGTNMKMLNVASPANGANVVEWRWSGSQAERWYGNDYGDLYFKFQNNDTHYCIDVQGHGDTNGTRVVQATCALTDYQTWVLSYAGVGLVVDMNGNMGNTDLYVMINLATGLCMDLRGNSSANGTRVQLWQCAQNDDPIPLQQLWFFSSKP
jgi:hypothetical protein